MQEVNIDTENDMTRFVLSCEVINGDVLRLNRANAQVIVGQSTGLRVPQAAVHYLKEDGSEAEGQGENYIPGVYVKYGNLARFCKDRPRGRPAPPGAGWRLSHRFAQRNGRFGQSGSPL